MKIIGFSGKKQSGKTTAVEDLKQRLEAQGKTVAIVPFATALKATVEDLFITPTGDMSPRNWDSDDFKNTVHQCGKTYRQILQEFGTGVSRTIWKDVWVENWKWSILNLYQHYDYVLVPDVRFDNEVRAIQSLGGKVIRLTRAPFADVDQHESETALDELEKDDMLDVIAGGIHTQFFDAILDNRTMSISEQNAAVWQLATGWYPELGGK